MTAPTTSWSRAAGYMPSCSVFRRRGTARRIGGGANVPAVGHEFPAAVRLPLPDRQILAEVVPYRDGRFPCGAAQVPRVGNLCEHGLPLENGARRECVESLRDCLVSIVECHPAS